jgi:bifunctional UDP-N-acetylglucosamine pyrophosphorylase/glucosamine-1-phosphate N-acetyltransferase
MSLSVVILAAGQGKRMKSDLPKVLQPLAGRPLLAHVIDSARAIGAAAVHVVYGHGGGRVREALRDESLRWVLQGEQLGTGHAVAQAMPAVADETTVLVLYGDVPLVRPQTLRHLIDRANERTLALLSVRMKDPTGYGRVVRDRGGRVVRIVEHKDANTKERAIDEVNTGLIAAPAASLRRWLASLNNDNAQGEYYLTDVVEQAVRDGFSIEALMVDNESEVLGVNDKQQLAEVEAVNRRRRAQELMTQGVTLVDPARFDARGEVQVGRDVYIDVNVVLEGTVKLGDRVRVGPNVVLRDCEVGADSEILASCVAEQAVIGASCRVGPFARLRPGAVIEDEAHIGNFVEIKKSRIKRGAKANHLSYIGDATVGERANVGAGTICCNYDGANKWPTEIGDGAFIGSGTMLVAPVRVGANATIGAGSTITHDAPAGKLTLERGRQITIEGWTRPEKSK